MAESECAFVANSLTITRVMELFDNLADYKFVTKAPVNAKGEVYVLNLIGQRSEVCKNYVCLVQNILYSLTRV